MQIQTFLSKVRQWCEYSIHWTIGSCEIIYCMHKKYDKRNIVYICEKRKTIYTTTEHNKIIILYILSWHSV